MYFQNECNSRSSPCISFLLKSGDDSASTKQTISTKKHNCSDYENVSKTKTTVSCKHCGETNALVGNYGRYGYYVYCESCEKTTAMKTACPCCGSKNTKISKKAVRYSLECRNCSHQQIVFEDIRLKEQKNLSQIST